MDPGAGRLPASRRAEAVVYRQNAVGCKSCAQGRTALFDRLASAAPWP
jgi:hypothetical protein